MKENLQKFALSNELTSELGQIAQSKIANSILAHTKLYDSFGSCPVADSDVNSLESTPKQWSSCPMHPPETRQKMSLMSNFINVKLSRLVIKKHCPKQMMSKTNVNHIHFYFCLSLCLLFLCLFMYVFVLIIVT
jgi:hypothetical protein